MIYFLTDWRAEMNNFESDVMFNLTKVFNDNDIEIKIINTQLEPFLNYFANQNGLYNWMNINDLLDSFLKVNEVPCYPLTMSDLKLVKDYERTYTKKNVVLSKKGVVKGEIYFNNFGFISKVRYLSKSGNETHIYSEKGYVLCKYFNDISGNQIKRQLFDKTGEVILTENNECIIIGKTYVKYCKKIIYATYKDLCIEMINTVLSNFNPKIDRIIIDGQSTLATELMTNFLYPETIILTFTGDFKQCVSQVNEHKMLIENSKGIVTDNVIFKSKIENDINYKDVKGKIDYMPFYPTALTLGESNTHLEQFVYWQIEQLDQRNKDTLLSFLNIKLQMDDLFLIVDSRISEDREELQNIVSTFVRAKFEINLLSFEYKLVEQYYEALNEEKMTPRIRDLFNTEKRKNPIFKKAIKAYLFMMSFKFRDNSNVQTLKNDFQKVRVFVDQRNKNEFLSHSLAVSFGIPIISSQASPYLIDEKNGILLNDNQYLINIVVHYLNDIDEWNQNLVESVDIIQKFDSYELMMKWQEKLK